jgi:hypothetical protein
MGDRVKDPVEHPYKSYHFSKYIKTDGVEKKIKKLP